MDNFEKRRTRANALIRARYQRMAPKYDRMEERFERRNIEWRKNLWSMVKGPNILEVGVGTGRNMEHYPTGQRIFAIDLTPGMLEKARIRARDLNLSVNLQLGDVQSLEFQDNSFDTAVATYVFCSVPNPIVGFRELKRVVKPGGQILLLEHTRSSNFLLGLAMDFVNPFSVWFMGDNINRRTVEHIQQAGLFIDKVINRANGGIFKQIIVTVEK